MSDSPTFGRYKIERELGRGAMGVVYLGLDAETGERFAVKTLSANTKRSLVQAIRLEIAGLARLAHPGIVKIVDDGVQDGLPWYAMTFVEGQTFRQLIRGQDSASSGLVSQPTLPSTTMGKSGSYVEVSLPGVAELDEIDRLRFDGQMVERLGVISALCDTLAYLHGEGMVHRDLKPDNILLDAEGNPILTDFGILSMSGGGSRDELRSEAWMVGSIHYMAPEQLKGQGVDPRTDLYALGCLLYRIVCGRTPFRGRSTQAIAAQHLTEAPLPPSDFVDELPEPIERLILGLLSKPMRERVGHADEVSRVLSGCGVPHRRFAGAPAAKTYLYRPRLAGRTEVLERLVEHVARPTGQLCLVGGRSGYGKTRLLAELTLACRVELRSVVLCRSAPGQEFEPFGALGTLFDFIIDHCREHGPDETRRVLADRAAVLSWFAPALATLDGVGDLPPVPVLGASEARQRLFEFMLETLEELTDRVGLVVIVDDLQWADPMTQEFLAFTNTLSHDVTTNLAWLGAYRVEAVTEGLERLLGGAVARIEVGPLDREAVEAMALDMMAADTVDGELVDFLLARSGGSPFYVREYLMEGVSKGVLARDGAGLWRIEAIGEALERLALPVSRAALVEKRLEGLSPTERRLLDAASVLGSAFVWPSLLELSGLEAREASLGLWELIRQNIFEAAGDEGVAGRIGFAHDKLCEVSYSLLEPNARRALHREAARILEARGADQRLAEVAHHLEAATAFEEACAIYIAAAREALVRSALDEAAHSLDAVRRLLPEAHPMYLEASWLKLDRISFEQGKHEASLEAAREIIALATRMGEHIIAVEASCVLSNALSSTTAVVEAERVLHEATEVAQRHGTAREQGMCMQAMSRLLRMTGRQEESYAYTTRSVALFEAHGLKSELALSLIGHSAYLMSHWRIEEVFDKLEKAHAIFEEMGDHTGARRVLFNLGTISVMSGRLVTGCRLLEEVMNYGRAIGSRRSGALFTQNFGAGLVSAGRYSEALVVLEHARTELRRLQQTRGLVTVGWFLAWAHIERGDLEAGRFELDAAFSRAGGGELVSGETLGYILWVRAMLEGFSGDWGAAADTLEQACAKCATSGENAEVALKIDRALALTYDGRPDEARALVEQWIEPLGSYGEIYYRVRKLCDAAMIRRWTGASVAEIEELLDRAEALLIPEEDPLSHIRARCERAQLAVLVGEDAAPALDEVEALLARMEPAPFGEHTRAVRRLRAVVRGVQ